MRNNYFKTLLLLLAVSFSSTINSQAQEVSGAPQFVHPGILHTEADFDRMKEKIKGRKQPWYQGWNKLIANSHASLSYNPNPTREIVRGGTGENYSAAMNDGAAAYQLAIRWKLSGDDKYADKAIQILDAWATTCVRVTGDSNAALASGIYGFPFANAAEIMRSYPGWSAANFERFKKFMVDVFYSYATDFMSRRNGACDTHYWANWGLANAATITAIGILCDDEFKFNEGMYYIKYSKENGREFAEDIQNLVWYLHTPTLGQWQESNRDQGHTLMGVGSSADVAQVAWNQGDDLYAFKNNRLLAGYEYIAKYNLGNDVPNVRYINCDNNQGSIGADGRGNTRPVWERVYNHYAKRKGLEAPFSQEFAEKIRPEGGGGDYGSNSGGFDNLGFGTLLYSLDTTFNPDCPETLLSPAIYVNDKPAVNHSIINVKPGDNLRLVCVQEESAGAWLWNTGETINEITLNNVQQGGMYRVTYTTPCGTTSSQSYCVAVYGDCLPTKISKTVQIQGTWYSDTIYTVRTATTVNMGCQPSYIGQMKYKINGNYVNSSGIVINENTTITAEYTNEGGAVSTQDFNFVIRDITPTVVVNSGTPTVTETVFVAPGSTVVLSPSGVNALSWSWSTGANSRTITLEDVQSRGEYTVTLTQSNGATSSLTFVVGVYQDELLKDGEYWLIDRVAGTYLTNINTTKPIFSDYVEDDQNQVWKISKDGERYKILSAKDNRYVNENGSFGTNQYYTEWNTMHIYKDGEFCAIQNGGKSGTNFWKINTNIIDSSVKDAGFIVDFPFILRPAMDTSLERLEVSDSSFYYKDGKIVIETSDNVTGIAQLFSITGVLQASKSIVAQYDELAVGKLAPGIYVLKVNLNGKLFVKKVQIL
ncbi:alginate lyase family protein [Viscerimonas tarda]